MIWWILGIVGFIIFLSMLGGGENNSSNLSDNDEQKIRQYIQKRAEMKRNCDGMWSLRGIGGKSNSEIIALCKPLGYDVKSKTWRYEPESVKKLLRNYGIYDQELLTAQIHRKELLAEQFLIVKFLSFCNSNL